MLLQKALGVVISGRTPESVARALADYGPKVGNKVTGKLPILETTERRELFRYVDDWLGSQSAGPDGSVKRAGNRSVSPAVLPSTSNG